MKKSKAGDEMDEQKQKITQATAERIRFLRRQKDISQEELALRAGINAVYYGQLERGLKCPTIDTLYKIAKGLEISLSELFRFEAASYSAKNNADRVEQLIKRIPESKVEQVLKIFEEMAGLLD